MRNIQQCYNPSNPIYPRKQSLWLSNQILRLRREYFSQILNASWVFSSAWFTLFFKLSSRTDSSLRRQLEVEQSPKEDLWTLGRAWGLAMTEQEVPAVKEELLDSRATACITIFGSRSDFRQLSLLLSREEWPLRRRSLFSLPSISVSRLSSRFEYSDCCVSEWARSEFRKPKAVSSRRSTAAWQSSASVFRSPSCTSWKLSPRKILGSPDSLSPMFSTRSSVLIPCSASSLPHCCSFSRTAARKPLSQTRADFVSPSPTYSQSISNACPRAYRTRSGATWEAAGRWRMASSLRRRSQKCSRGGRVCVTRTTTIWKADLGPSKGQLSFSSIDIIYFFNIYYQLLLHSAVHSNTGNSQDTPSPYRKGRQMMADLHGRSDSRRGQDMDVLWSQTGL